MRVFLTGITGFVGGCLAARLLTRGVEVIALVRGGSQEVAEARAAASLKRFGLQGGRSLRVVPGDLADVESAVGPMLEKVTHVVHAAACTSFASTREVYRTNVVGTESLASCMHKAPHLQRFLHVSTAYVCGDNPASAVFENDSPRKDHGHLNDYTRSKAQAERQLSAMGFGERLVVARPSVVIGHSVLGVAPSSSLYWYYQALAELGAGPFPLEARRDIVSVDYVAAALDFLLSKREPLQFSTYHLSAGQKASAPAQRIFEAMGHRLEGWQEATPEHLERMQFARSLPAGTAIASRLARGVKACARFGGLGVDHFDNTRLLAEGGPSPIPFPDYAGLCAKSARGTLFDRMVDDA